MLQQDEYAVRLTADGKLTAWEMGAQSFESAIREMGNALVGAAQAIAEYPRVDGSEDWLIDLSIQWHMDLDKLPAQARRLALTRMVVAGIPEPRFLRFETDDQEG